jgi:hypothetical protein
MTSDQTMGWFAGLVDEDERDDRWPWAPMLQIPGECHQLTPTFATEEDCLSFIRRHILGKPILP